MFKRLLEKRVHVKPLNVGSDLYQVRIINSLENFWDDFTRYGLGVAIHDFIELMTSP